MATWITNIVFDTNYEALVPGGGFPIFQQTQTTQPIQTNQTIQITQASQTTPVTVAAPDKKPKKEEKKSGGIFGIFEKMASTLLWWGEKKWKKDDWKNKTAESKDNKNGKIGEENKEKQPETAIDKLRKDTWIRSEVQKMLKIPDDEFSYKKLNSNMRQYILEVEKHYSSTISNYKSHIAPSYWEFKGTNFNVSGVFGRTYYAQSYPSYIESLWTRDLLAFHGKWDMSFFLYPEDSSAIQGMLKQKATQLKAEINNSIQKWITLDTEIEQQYKDVDMIRKKLTTHEERYYELGFYFSIYHEDEAKLKEESKKIEQKIAWFWIKIKPATQRMDEWFTSTLPVCVDDLAISRSAVTTSLAGSFPFIANDLVADTGILYGINMHTWWLVIFDRFNSKLPNMNSVILATSGAWKSFTVKLEILRYLLNGIDVIVIDPENEYHWLCKQVGGTYVNVATSSQQFINPFDLPAKIEDITYWKWDLLRSHIMNLIWLIELLIWKLTSKEEALLDKALQSTYSLKWFEMDVDSYDEKESPLMLDLMNTLEWMDGWDDIALRLSKYVTGTFGKLFNNYTNVDINNKLTVFSIRDLEEVLKTPAMFNVLNYIWNKVKSNKKPRLLVCDEAWILLQHEVSANYLFGLTKRARKYWLWITTISQDIEDFVKSKYGKPIISNSAFQILLKQSTTSIKSLNDLLWLSKAEQQRLISVGVWEWLIFAWPQHIAVKILASPEEKAFITTDVTGD